MISFSFSNTPISFQGNINMILIKKLNILVSVYLDNIFVYIEDLNLNYIDAIK